jgi:hypothetical protein
MAFNRRSLLVEGMRMLQVQDAITVNSNSSSAVIGGERERQGAQCLAALKLLRHPFATITGCLELGLHIL